jgi:hypothetical protein
MRRRPGAEPGPKRQFFGRYGLRIGFWVLKGLRPSRAEGIAGFARSAAGVSPSFAPEHVRKLQGFGCRNSESGGLICWLMLRGSLGGAQRHRCFGSIAKTTDTSRRRWLHRFTMHSRETEVRQSLTRSLHTATTDIVSSSERVARKSGDRWSKAILPGNQRNSARDELWAFGGSCTGPWSTGRDGRPVKTFRRSETAGR